MMRTAMMVVSLAMALSACKGGDKKETGGQASGEVLPGSVSDAMLPLDTVKSQAPLAPGSAAKGDEKGAKGNAAKPSPKPANEPAPASESADEGE